MRKYLMVIVALSIMMSGCGKDEEPMTEQAAGEAAMEKEADTAEGAAMEEQEGGTAMDSMQEETGAVEEGAASMEEEAAQAADDKTTDMTQGEEKSVEESSSMAEETVAEADAGGDAVQGKQIYDKACFTCHAQGIAGAPKIGDKAAWESRIAKGMDTLVNNALNGFQGESGVMPPKGGFMNLSDEEVTAAVAYMVAQSQ